MKQIIYKIMKQLLLFSLNYVYNYIDSNKDGKLDKKELKDLLKKIEKFKK